MEEKDSAIAMAASWTLRIGLLLSVTAMLTGTAISFMHHTLPLDRMQHATFESSPRVIWQGVCDGRGQAVIEVGIYLLVLTPILRVVTSMILFAVVERDWVYVLITAAGLLLTLAGLLILK